MIATASERTAQVDEFAIRIDIVERRKVLLITPKIDRTPEIYHLEAKCNFRKLRGLQFGSDYPAGKWMSIRCDYHPS
jgi:hypothetical protein